MAYVALEWDHKIGRPIIQWLVVKCSSVGQKFGGPQALPPRRDVAYFVDEKTAERDARAFAAYKTRQDERADSTGNAEAYSKRHAAFSWDHNIFNPLIQWAVLEWNGENPDGESFRTDVAYFLDPQTAETDAKAFRVIRDELVASEPTVGRISPNASKRARNRSAA
ncbi:MAG: hypothetical protein ACRD3J_31595 [Thermoanaerobaculia bacterium]